MAKINRINEEIKSSFESNCYINLKSLIVVFATPKILQIAYQYRISIFAFHLVYDLFNDESILFIAMSFYIVSSTIKISFPTFS